MTIDSVELLGNMFCAKCNEEFDGKPIRQGGECFCSLECANLASGIAPEEEDGYFEEAPMEEYFENEDE